MTVPLPPEPRAKSYELRQREYAYAMAGYEIWDAFVRECERELHLTWAEIRERFQSIPIVEPRRG